MQKERKITGIAKYIAGAVVGGAAIIGARESNVDNAISDLFFADKNTVNVDIEIESQEIQGQTLTLPLEETKLSEEILQSLSENMVTVYRNTTLAGSDLNLGGTCSGFISRNKVNTPIVITAHHCVPNEVEVEEETLPTFDSEGTSIFKVTATNNQGQTYIFRQWYQLEGGETDKDLLAANLLEEKEITANSIPLNVKEPEKWETNYVIKKIENDVIAIPVRYYTRQEDNSYIFIDFESTGINCSPGISGSPIVNSVGEITALVTNINTHILTAQDVKELNLNSIHEGRVVKVCIGPAAGQIKTILDTSY